VQAVLNGSAIIANKDILLKSVNSSPVIVVLAFFLVFFIQGCTHSPEKKPFAPEVSLAEDHRMQFRGKGAGAGMMLSSSMGPMGIAIGVAIDEGIAKQIGETATAGDVDIQVIVQQAFVDADKKYTQPLKVRVLKYGFVTVPAGGDYSDPVVAELVLELETSAASTSVINVYADVGDGICEPMKYELDAVKTSSGVIEEAFVGAAECGSLLLDSSGQTALQ